MNGVNELIKVYIPWLQVRALNGVNVLSTVIRLEEISRPEWCQCTCLKCSMWLRGRVLNGVSEQLSEVIRVAGNWCPKWGQ